MLDTLLKSPYVIGSLHLLTAVMLLVSALVISSVVRMNKGARANTAFIVIAIGTIVASAVPVNQAMLSFGLVDFTHWNIVITLSASVIILSGLYHWRRIISKMIE